MTYSFRSDNCDTDHSRDAVANSDANRRRITPPGIQRMKATTNQNFNKSAILIKSLKDVLLTNPLRGIAQQRCNTLRDTIHRTEDFREEMKQDPGLVRVGDIGPLSWGEERLLALLAAASFLAGEAEGGQSHNLFRPSRAYSLPLFKEEERVNLHRQAAVIGGGGATFRPPSSPRAPCSLSHHFCHCFCLESLRGVFFSWNTLDTCTAEPQNQEEGRRPSTTMRFFQRRYVKMSSTSKKYLRDIVTCRIISPVAMLVLLLTAITSSTCP
ncbi:unnamed protein product [Acanthosepion pharaonis]|uniref:Uncharacterized protein n=1 Tax=Acanthosepion pharaonis TaxID=158019 RepID=A0A812CBC9_ACAPH|nr:unnamed protein product [Sepia pharaonis]